MDDKTALQLNKEMANRIWQFEVRVPIPARLFDDMVTAVGVTAAPDGFRGVAGFRLLNRFDDGNFGNPTHFGLER